MSQTPRLCIDGRAAQEFKVRGMVAQEVIDDLVSAGGEPEASEWIERRRTVLLTHPGQVFSGQLKRFDTRHKIGNSPFTWLWERTFTQNAELALFHRFRPLDKIGPGARCETLTTVLPPSKGFPLFLPRKGNHRYVVPSRFDKKLLQKRYTLEDDQIIVMTPSIRRYVYHGPSVTRTPEGMALVAVGKEEESKFKKLSAVLKTVYPTLKLHPLRLKGKVDIAPLAWAKLLSNSRVFFYLNAGVCDWATLASEDIYWNVPTVYLDENRALDELLPPSNLRLKSFLVNQPEISALERLTSTARQTLDELGIFQPLHAAKQYREIYGSIMK